MAILVFWSYFSNKIIWRQIQVIIFMWMSYLTLCNHLSHFSWANSHSLYTIWNCNWFHILPLSSIYLSPFLSFPFSSFLLIPPLWLSSRQFCCLFFSISIFFALLTWSPRAESTPRGPLSLVVIMWEAVPNNSKELLLEESFIGWKGDYPEVSCQSEPPIP